MNYGRLSISDLYSSAFFSSSDLPQAVKLNAIKEVNKIVKIGLIILDS